MTLTLGGLTVDIQNDNDRKLFDQLLKDNSDLREAMLQAMRSGQTPQDAMAALVQTAKSAVAAVANVRNPILFKTAAAQFIATRETLTRNRRSTAGEKARTLELLQQHLTSIGVDPDKVYVHELERDKLIGFISSYARRRGKEAPSAPDGKPGATETTELLSARTVVKAIGHLDDFFVYAASMHWVAQSPIDDAFHKAMDGLRAAAAQDKAANNYELFSLHEIRRIFDPASYLKNLNAADEFWAPLIGLFTGARLGEIAVLSVDSIYFDAAEGVYVMDVARTVRGQRATKNNNSVRKVPLCDTLLQLGFLDYVSHVRELEAKELFPHRPLNPTRMNDPSKHLSRSFGEYLEAVGIQSPTKVFHSLRHTVITHLHTNKVPVGDAQLIVGHAAQDLHMRLSATSSNGTARSQTHLKTYVDAAGYATDDLPLLARLKLHLDHALRYPIDIAGLRAAALIVQEETERNPDGSFASGWHTNNKDRAKKMQERLAGLRHVQPAAAGGEKAEP